MLEGAKREKGIREMFEEMMTANFPKLNSDTNPQVQKAQQGPAGKNIKNYTQEYHFQTTGNQRQRENLERSQKEKNPYL